MKQRKPRKKKRNITRKDTNELAGTRKIRGKKEAERAGKRTQKQHIPMVICVVGESNSVLSTLSAAFVHYVMMSTTLHNHCFISFSSFNTFSQKNTMTTVAPCKVWLGPLCSNRPRGVLPSMSSRGGPEFCSVESLLNRAGNWGRWQFLESSSGMKKHGWLGNPDNFS